MTNQRPPTQNVNREYVLCMERICPDLNTDCPVLPSFYTDILYDPPQHQKYLLNTMLNMELTKTNNKTTDEYRLNGMYFILAMSLV